jgi:threonine dehydratase
MHRSPPLSDVADPPTRQSIRETTELIRPFVRLTPTVEYGDDSGGVPPVVLKLESMQRAGSFKTRGAFSNLAHRLVPAGGVVAASGGNHGAAVAYAAKQFGIPATIFVPAISSPAKIARIREYGAELVVTGTSYAEALDASERWAADRDVLAIHAFDQLETIVGQGTLALELEEQLPDVDIVLAAVGGGGLLAGIAAWFGRRARIVGVEPVRAPTLTRAVEAGHPVDADGGGIAADSLAPLRVGERVFALVQPVLDRTVLVTDDDIVAAQRHLWEKLRVVAEPGGATAFAAVLSGAFVPPPGARVAVVVSGGNTTAVEFK